MPSLMPIDDMCCSESVDGESLCGDPNAHWPSDGKRKLTYFDMDYILEFVFSGVQCHSEVILIILALSKCHAKAFSVDSLEDGDGRWLRGKTYYSGFMAGGLFGV